jgi:hypothetical protein
VATPAEPGKLKVFKEYWQYKNSLAHLKELSGLD